MLTVYCNVSNGLEIGLTGGLRTMVAGAGESGARRPRV